MDLKRLLQHNQNLEDFVVGVVFKFGIGRVDLFILEQRVLPTLMNYLVADGIFAYLALQRLVAVVPAVRGLELDSFAPEPALQAVVVHIFD